MICGHKTRYHQLFHNYETVTTFDVALKCPDDVEYYRYPPAFTHQNNITFTSL